MQGNDDAHKYEEIIHLPHHTSPNRPRMSMVERAAQFSPFSALTGYEAAVEEAARLTDRKRELSEEMKAFIDERIRVLEERLDESPEVSITYFVPDTRKDGGEYIHVVGTVKEIDTFEHCLIMSDQKKIRIEQIREIEGQIFQSWDWEE